jgi:hypothetical protein
MLRKDAFLSLYFLGIYTALSRHVDGTSIIEDPQFQACLRGGVKDENKFSWPTLFFSKECIFI